VKIFDHHNLPSPLLTSSGWSRCRPFIGKCYKYKQQNLLLPLTGNKTTYLPSKSTIISVVILEQELKRSISRANTCFASKRTDFAQFFYAPFSVTPQRLPSPPFPVFWSHFSSFGWHLMNTSLATHGRLIVKKSHPPRISRDGRIVEHQEKISFLEKLLALVVHATRWWASFDTSRPVASEKANSHDRGPFDLQNASLKRENLSLAQENYMFSQSCQREAERLKKSVGASFQSSPFFFLYVRDLSGGPNKRGY
jgi:hypothetical protein